MYTGATIASYQACTQLEDFLLSRITKSNHNIKYKCLQIIKVINSDRLINIDIICTHVVECFYYYVLLFWQHVCRSGRPEFKRDMGRSTGPIKDCLRKFTLLFSYS